MKYRAKCTHCIALVESLYNRKNNYFPYDKKDTYIEVDTEREADIIETLNDLIKETARYYTMLADERRIEPNI